MSLILYYYVHELDMEAIEHDFLSHWNCRVCVILSLMRVKLMIDNLDSINDFLPGNSANSNFNLVILARQRSFTKAGLGPLLGLDLMTRGSVAGAF